MDIPKQEEQILRFWKQIRAFEKSVENRPRGRQFVFYEGPPTANGQPGIHHVLARAFKDIICRYKTMQGYRVERKAGWDTHGLPVEVEVEKELGLRSKKDVEKYGIAKFNEKCRKSVWKYKQEWDNLTERIAFWLDLENPYITYDPLYMETLWWIIKQAHEKKLLYEGHKVVPCCPRCGTSLSSHEVAQGYEDITEDSVFVKFQVSEGLADNFSSAHSRPASAGLRGSGWFAPTAVESDSTAVGDHAKPALKSAEEKLSANPKIYLLAWTTTPWTLPGNVALAVGEKIDYALVRQNKEYYILAKERLGILSAQGTPASGGECEYKIIKEFKGKELEGIQYEPLFDSLKDAKEKKHFVALADFVSTEEGTGIVHTAVMYGEEDYNLGQKLGLPKIHTVDEAGKFNKRVPQWMGKFVKDVEPEIVEDLASRNLLYKKEPYTHSYPFCWRCKSPLLYYAMQSWFIKMSVLRAKLIASNKKINWVPKHIQKGRFGEWLREVKDWNFSRRRFWGTPLPVWKCKDCSNIQLMGSREDISSQKFSTNTFFILRHGESEKNHKANPIISSRWPEARKYHLTNRGRQQVQNSAELLKGSGGVDLIFASDFTRTKETAGIVAKELGLNVSYDKRLREYNLGVYDGLPEGAFYEDFPDHKERFKKAPTRGETTARVQQRMFHIISSLNKKYKNKRILLVSHGDPIWVLESRLLGLTIEETLKRRKANYPKVGQLRNIVFRHFPYSKEAELDFHRPYVDEISFGCAKCSNDKNSMERVEDLVDVWFDSGSMPFASASAKATADKQGKIKAPVPFPADYICEAVDQTRGWFYTLLGVSTILGYGSPYSNVISLAHVLDKYGKKMSKSKGNVLDPWNLLDKYGSDALRWYFYTFNQPGDSKNFDEADVQKAYRKFISTLWNTLQFFKTYSGFKIPSSKKQASNKSQKTNSKPRNVLDGWIVSRLASVIQNVAKNLDAYDVTGAARAIESFVIDDLSNWYVRRSRKRFQNPETKKEKKEAEQTLGYVLFEISRLCAPFAPFLSEQIYQELQLKAYSMGASSPRAEKAESVHWEDFPNFEEKFINRKLENEMIKARKIVEIVHEVRARYGIRVRQPLSEVQMNVELSEDVREIVADEINVKNVGYRKPLITKGAEWRKKTGGDITVSLNTELTSKLREEGFTNEFVRHVQSLRRAGGFVPRDKIELRHSTTSQLSKSIHRWSANIKKQNNAQSIIEGGDKKETFEAEGEFEWEGKKVWVGIKLYKK